MSDGRRRAAALGLFLALSLLWSAGPGIETADAGGRVTRRFNRVATAKPVPARPGGSGAVRRQRLPAATTARRVHTWRVPPPAKRRTGTTVLGRYPRYVFRANRGTPHRYHQVPPRHDRGGVRRWRANRKFLDRTILRRDRIVLASPPGKARPGSGFARELAYLRSKGYRISRDGKRLLPPAGSVRITRPGRISGKFNAGAATPRPR